MPSVLFIFGFLAFVFLKSSLGNSDSRRLYDDLLEKEYNKLARPVKNSSHPVQVMFGLKFAQLIDVVYTFIQFLKFRVSWIYVFVFSFEDEKNEIMTTNMWAVQVRLIK